jgi:hypothetical protein
MFEYSLFHKLPVWTQVEVLAQKGNFIAQRKHKDYTISLYSLDNYFVEVWAKGKLRISTSFRETTKPLIIMDQYLDEISLELF